jgi:glycopeptide antibiotics resistance protein
LSQSKIAPYPINQTSEEFIMVSFAPVAVITIISYLILAISIGFKKRVPLRKQVLLFVFFLYLLEVVSITLFPIPYHYAGGKIQMNNLVPFSTIMGFISRKDLFNGFCNIGGNILLFVPFGFMFPLVFRGEKRLIRMVVIGFAATLVVESSQFIISSILGFTYRSFDVDDLILNTLGTFLGYLSLRAVLIPIKKLQRLELSKRRWVYLLFIIIVLGSYWGYEYDTHLHLKIAIPVYGVNVPFKF